MSGIMVLLIKIYQKTLSPLFRGSCRHYPSCSQYGVEAFQTHGFFYGGYLTIVRVLKCNPFFEGGFDPVPEKKQDTKDIHKLSVKAE